MSYSKEIDVIQELVDSAQHIVIVQADNPDGDSLASSLALEEIFGDMGKKTHMYCGVDMPGYLHYVAGWDRVSSDLPKAFDLSVIVDASTMTLLETLEKLGNTKRLNNKPCVVLDHHSVVHNEVPFATVILNDSSRSSTGELIYELAQQLKWELNLRAQECVMIAILGDTQGLSNSLTNANTYKIMASLTEAGVDRPMLEELRREYSKMPEKIYRYKAELIQRTELFAEGRIACVVIPQAEINEYSPLYNPVPLIQNDMLQIQGISVAIVLKHYKDGKITGAIRCSPGAGIGSTLAGHFGGGGHPYASGFKVIDSASFPDFQKELLKKATDLLDNPSPGDQSS